MDKYAHNFITVPSLHTNVMIPCWTCEPFIKIAYTNPIGLNIEPPFTKVTRLDALYGGFCEDLCNDCFLMFKYQGRAGAGVKTQQKLIEKEDAKLIKQS